MTRRGRVKYPPLCSKHLNLSCYAARVHVCSSAPINSLSPETGWSRRASLETSEPLQGHFCLLSHRPQSAMQQTSVGKERQDAMSEWRQEVVSISANPGVIAEDVSKGQ